MSNLGYAYAAGIVDGEGTIGVWREKRSKNKSGFRYRVALEISNTDERLTNWFAENFGGFTATVNTSRTTCKPLYKWRATTSEVGAICKKLEPYLIIKKEQARLVTRFEDVKRKYDQRPGKRQDGQALIEMERLWREGKALNKRGA